MNFFSFEALVSLLAAASVIVFLVHSVPSKGFEDVYRFQLLQDFLETSVTAKLEAVNAFGDGDIAAKSFLERAYARELKALGLTCLKAEAKGNSLSVGCAGNETVKFSGKRMVFDGDSFHDFRVSLCFDS